MAYELKYYMVICFDYLELHFLCCILCVLITVHLTLSGYKDTLLFDQILLDFETLRCHYG